MYVQSSSHFLIGCRVNAAPLPCELLLPLLDNVYWFWQLCKQLAFPLCCVSYKGALGKVWVICSFGSLWACLRAWNCFGCSVAFSEKNGPKMLLWLRGISPSPGQNKLVLAVFLQHIGSSQYIRVRVGIFHGVQSSLQCSFHICTHWLVFVSLS